MPLAIAKLPKIKNLSRVEEMRLAEKLARALKGEHVQIRLGWNNAKKVMVWLLNHNVRFTFRPANALVVIETQGLLVGRKHRKYKAHQTHVRMPILLRKRCPYIRYDRVVWRFFSEHPEEMKILDEGMKGLSDEEKVMLLCFLKSRALYWCAKHYPRYSYPSMVNSRRYGLNIYIALRLRYAVGKGHERLREDIRLFKDRLAYAKDLLDDIMASLPWIELRDRLLAFRKKRLLEKTRFGILVFLFEHAPDPHTFWRKLCTFIHMMPQRFPNLLKKVESIQSPRYKVSKDVPYAYVVLAAWSALFVEAFYGIKAELMLGLGLRESNLRPYAHNRMGAVGWYQLTRNSAVTQLFFPSMRTAFNKVAPMKITAIASSLASAARNPFLNTLWAARTLLLKCGELGISVNVLMYPERAVEKVKQIMRAYQGFNNRGDHPSYPFLVSLLTDSEG